MSQYGIGEMYRWAAQVRGGFPWLPVVSVTDDYPVANQASFGGLLPDGRGWIRLWREMIPGQAVGWHEMCHLIQRVVEERTQTDGIALFKAAFVARGADPALVDSDSHLAMEQMASMLPEAFGHGWGGYEHPCINVPVPEQMRNFFLSLETWEPVSPPDTNVSAPHTIEWVGVVPLTNYSIGRAGNPITLIVDHWTVVDIEGAIRGFQRYGETLSAHFIIGQNGRIVQMVSEDGTAYHAGKIAINYISIGIEHEASPTMPPTEAQYAASAWLHARLSEKHSIPLEAGATVLRHKQVVPTECPGTLDVERIVREAGGDDMSFTDDDRRMLRRVYDHLEAYEPLTWTERLQKWLARGLKSEYPGVDLGGPDVRTGAAFKSDVP